MHAVHNSGSATMRDSSASLAHCGTELRWLTRGVSVTLEWPPDW